MEANQSPEVKAILKLTHDLTAALSNDCLGMAGLLLSKELISREVFSKMLIDSYTPAEKAAILIQAVGNLIEIAPFKFQCFLEILSEQVCAKVVAEKLRSTYQSELKNIVLSSPEQEYINIAERIQNLEDCFDNMRRHLTTELEQNILGVKELVNTLISLPLKLKREYEHSISLRLSVLRTETTINGVMIHLSALMTFLDYSLLEFLIKKFGSDHLMKDMRSYCSNMQIFMKETTIKQLVDHFPGQAEAPPKFALIESKIGENASKCTLEQLNTIRRRYCSEVSLSEIVFHLLTVVDPN